MPIASFLTMVFETKYPINTTFTVKHIISTINKGSNQFLLNSILYSLLTAIFGTVFAFVCAYANSRMKNRISKYLHLISLVSMAIPGIVLGLSYVMFFHDKYIYGGLFIIVIVNSIHFFSSPYLLAYGALEKLNMNLEAVGLSLGIKRINIIIDVIIPKMKHTITEMMSYFFINSMMTISAVSFLAPPSPKPIALMINQFEAQLLMESAAFVTLIILITNITIKVFFAKIANKLTNNSIS